MTHDLPRNALGRYPIGVLGGMGPLATVDFLRRLVSETPAETGQDHLALIVRFCPEVPDRAQALLQAGPSPEPARPGASIGLLATRGVSRSGLYRQRAGAATQWVEPDDGEQASWVEPGIAAVKRGRIDEAAQLLGDAARRLIGRGAGLVLMGCTEVPLALQDQALGVPTVDSIAALARACVRWPQQQAQASGTTAATARIP